jgi:hypothetical protein
METSIDFPYFLKLAIKCLKEALHKENIKSMEVKVHSAPLCVRTLISASL